MDEPALLEASIDIAAAPGRVWELVHDPEQMSRWSPQVTSTRLKDGASPGLGARFTNRNADGELVWTTRGEIVRFVPGEEMAFRIEENWVTWSFRLTPVDGGTRLSQRRETPEGISPLSKELTDGFMGGQERFTELMRAGMRDTLTRIKAAAES